MSSDFDRALQFILRPNIEGGYVNDPADPGGETKYGISKRAYPLEDIRNLTTARAGEIYRRDYWSTVRGDDLSWPVNLILFDCAVNQGLSTAILLLQRCALLGVVDGKFGPQTLAAARAMAAADLASALLRARMQRYWAAPATLRERFGLGWACRLLDVALTGGI